jgi:hypothetical protein
LRSAVPLVGPYTLRYDLDADKDGWIVIERKGCPGAMGTKLAHGDHLNVTALRAGEGEAYCWKDDRKDWRIFRSMTFTETPEAVDNVSVCRSYVEMLADIYGHIRKPRHVRTDWRRDVVGRMVKDIMRPENTSVHEGRFFFPKAYVDYEHDDKQLWTLLQLLHPLEVFTRKHPEPKAERAAAGLGGRRRRRSRPERETADQLRGNPIRPDDPSGGCPLRLGDRPRVVAE